MSNKKIFKISDEEIKKMYLEGNSLNDIARVAQDTKGLMALRNRLIELGVSTAKDMKRYSHKISVACKRYSLDEHVFDVIDTEDKAYWLGWLFSDGYNHVSKRQVSLRIHEKDNDILYKLQKFFHTDAPICTYTRITKDNSIQRRYSELRICSPYLSERLAELGCTQAKTFTLRFPNIPEYLYQHFIRGYFDGDGCFSVIKRNDRKSPSSYTYQFNIVGMTDFLLKVQEIIVHNTGVKSLPLKTRSGKRAVTMRYSGRLVCKKILDYLYKDASVYLNRKYEKYCKYCTAAE